MDLTVGRRVDTMGRLMTPHACWMRQAPDRWLHERSALTATTDPARTVRWWAGPPAHPVIVEKEQRGRGREKER